MTTDAGYAIIQNDRNIGCLHDEGIVKDFDRYREKETAENPSLISLEPALGGNLFIRRVIPLSL